MKASFLLLPLFFPFSFSHAEPPPRSVSGIYPSLAMFNQEGECGTGAVVPWAGRLWVITYGPHRPFGSSDKLYEITPELTQIIRPESIGGTPANRMIHKESNQLAIGPYLIDSTGNVRVIPWQKMPGRLTGSARHLTDPANKLYYATMEEALYEVDIHSLQVRGLIKDGNPVPKSVSTAEDHPAPVSSTLPGYHGKGLYSGQGRVVYANNGENSPLARMDPTIPSGALGEWKGEGEWSLVRRNQFTEVTGPGGIFGSSSPETDPIWSVGWDSKSLLLMLLEKGEWQTFRLPKSSNSYDGAHGWNTEWPRIRDIGETNLLMTMHGAFWDFPKTFDSTHSGGITPRSNYLKVIGDFARWNDRIVFGCDDTAKSEFLNKRKLKGDLAAPGQSQSNLWFVAPDQLDRLGPVVGRGNVWVDESIPANQPSDPYLFNGYAHRCLFLSHQSPNPVRFSLEVDRDGSNHWSPLKIVEVPASGALTLPFDPKESAAWIRVRPESEAKSVSASFVYRNSDTRPQTNAPQFAPIAQDGGSCDFGGLLLTTGKDTHNLRVLTKNKAGKPSCYDLDGNLQFQPVADPGVLDEISKATAIPEGVISTDAASVVYEDGKKRWRLPKGNAEMEKPSPYGKERICREVSTERDLFNMHGTFYELPAENAGGFSKIRPVATHNLRIHDYASYRGMLVLSGLKADAKADSHVVRSEDGVCALWLGAIDDLWALGKPRGHGGPWHDTEIQANTPSDAYLIHGYDRKSLTLSHRAASPVRFLVEVDPTGDGTWLPYQEFTVKAGETHQHAFPESFSAAWVRLVSDSATKASAEFLYE